MLPPKTLTIPFARDALPAFKRDIPDNPPGTGEDRFASWTEGFPALTMTPLEAGGKPPEGPDINGVMAAISEHTVYQNTGGVYLFSSAVVDAGGYRKGAILLSNDGTALWKSKEDSNVEDFNSPNPDKWTQITVDDLLGELNKKALKATKVTAGIGLDGGGDLSVDRELSVKYGNTAGTAVEGDDPRIGAFATMEQAREMLSGALVITPLNLKQVFYPELTGPYTANGTVDNVISMTGIVSALDLEVGDVIGITGSTGAENDRLMTVDSITDPDTIIVNYEHAGNRSDGSLKLSDQSGVTVTVKRVSKWFNASDAMGRAWVSVPITRDVYITNDSNRVMLISSTAQQSQITLEINGKSVLFNTQTATVTSLWVSVPPKCKFKNNYTSPLLYIMG